MIDADIADALRPYLQTGERIVWTGRPVQGVRLTGYDVFLIPFSVLWCGFAIFWETMAVAGASAGFSASPGAAAATAPFALFGIPFVVMGLYFVFGRFLADAWVRSRMIYALTDRRALVLRRIFGEQLSAVSLTHCPGLSLNLRGSRGDVEFEPRPFFLRGYNMWMPSVAGGTRFLGIEDASDGFRLAQQGGGQP